MRHLSLFILFMVLLASCSPKQTIETEQTSLSKSFCLTPACNDSLSLSFELEYPTKLDNADALRIIQRDLLTHCFGKDYADMTLAEAMDAYVAFSKEEYLANNRAYASRLEEYEDEFAANLSEEQVLRGRVYSLADGVLSYELEQYVYMGGAHGVNNRLFYNYSTDTGARLTEKDVFIKGSEAELAQLLQNALIEQSDEYTSREDFIEAGFEFDSIHPNGNFALTEDAVTYVFNPYEIAPYVFGETEIVLDKSMLKPILK